jgi:hypothetical protein
MALGLLHGLVNCQHNVEAGTVLAYAGPDVTDDLAWSVRDKLVKANLDLPEDFLEDLPADSGLTSEA